ncbi:MAG: 1-acyl-sn-glycerol-3-phosphate acyltransferase [Planctomycetaceae bacterium]|jgi:1-acyl-sn-glycerol-3-phosphate acyltransferase|nr:1-acyl-sn-glycerol-3-phosphate acyltransferase [Planctomycetaceae bacterium]
MRKISWQKRLLYACLHFLLNVLFRLFYRVRFFGQHNLPESGAVILISNHQSHFDPPILGIGLRRRLNFLARKSLFRFKPFAWLIDMLDAIPLETNGIGFAGIKESIKRLKNGEVILVFPEGGRTWDGNIAPFLQGSLTLAQRTKSAILPAAVSGCYEIFPRTKKYPRLWGRVRVVYGKLILYEEFKELTEEELRHLCEAKIADLFRESPVT